MAQVATVTYADGTTEHYPILPADIIRTERQFGLRLGGGFKVEDLTAEQAFFLMYSAAKRMKRTVAEFDDWMDTVEDVGDASVPLEPSRNGAVPSPPLPESLSAS